MKSRLSHYLSEKILWIIGLGGFFFFCYGQINHFTSELAFVPHFYMEWEKKIPFIPSTIVPYMSTDLLFIFAFLFCSSKSELRTFAKQVILLILASVLFFYLIPLKYMFIRPDLSGSIWEIWFLPLNLDQPFNQLPSMHISFSYLYFRLLAPKLSGWFKTLFTIWIGLIYVSTLTVYQHHFIDIPTGHLMGILVLGIFPYNAHREMSTRSSRRYYLGTMMSLVLAVSFSGVSSYFFYYLATSLLLIAKVYEQRWHGVFSKGKGKIPILKKLIFAPFLLGSYLGYVYQKRRVTPGWADVDERIIFGRKLSREDLSGINLAKDDIVIDLAPEIEELPYCYKRDHYLHFSIMDLSLPAAKDFNEWIHRVHQLMASHPEKKIYIHCSMGFSRSALFTIGLLAKNGIKIEEAHKLLLEKRPQVLLTSHHIDFLNNWHSSQKTP